MAKVLITGTSSGLGMATALDLGRAGHKVFATMRNPARAPELAQRASREGLPVTVLTLDVEEWIDSVAVGAAAAQQPS